MYQKRFNSSSRGKFSRPGFHKRPFGHGSSPAFASRGNVGKRGAQGSYINPAKFINKNAQDEVAVAYTPQYRFADFPITPALKNNIIAKNYDTPTPIQDKAIPHVLQGKDVVGIANTGTGKTAAFLIPLINKVLGDAKEQVLIIVPTRELAIQIDAELKGFTRGMRLFSVCVVGGASIGPQLSALRHKNNFVIGTPGRLKDLIERGSIRLNEYQTVVLDEADRMLDMGFINDMRYVMKGMPQARHTLFFSATLSREIEGLIKEFLRDPVHVSVKTGDTAKNVEQDVVKIIPGTQKVDVLHELLIQKEFNKVLIFGRTKHGVEKLSKLLASRGFAAESIHGNKSHSQRQRALAKFKDNHAQVLVATDVAARGLDIANVSHVINYDLPMTYDDYVHRIGRTGRGDKRGKALTFIE
ncbi:MAG: DEAD/DEAH box helicase [Patescibacteria group bacterium]